MLFWKIGGTSFSGGIDYPFCSASLTAIFLMFILSSLVIKNFNITSFQAGSFSQSCYRFNTYIGMAVILNSFGGEGVKYFGLLIGFAIPLINVFAVSTLIWFSGRDISFTERFAITTKAVVVNPLILGCVVGLLYSHMIGWFPAFIDNAFSLMSMVALPLALISIGGNLTFAGLRNNMRLSVLAALLKLLLLPVIGYLCYRSFGVTGLPLRVGMVFFALPASPAIYVLSSQFSSDTELASAAIVLSTIFSFISLSIVLVI